VEPAAVATHRRLPAWTAALVPLAVLAVAIAAFVALGAPGLERHGVPVEDVTVERTVLRPGEIELRLRNAGPDPVTLAQAIVNDQLVPFTADDRELGRLEGERVHIPYPWIEGEAYEIALLTSTGGTVETAIDSAAETPAADLGFLGLMGLVGLYVGIIPVAIGMLWLPWIRRVDARWIRFVLALTVGLLAFLGIDALLEGSEIAASGAGAFGGAALVWLGALAAYLALAGIDAGMRARRARARAAGAGGFTLALLVAIGVGLHNLGEGLAIGSAYAVGSLALGASLVVGFALHNTTEGLAIVAPASGGALRPRRLVLLGLVAGAPAILGAVIGATAFNAALAAFLFGLGAGAIAQVVVQLAPSLRDDDGRLLGPLTAGGVLAGLALMYATGLLISLR
jgi:zinc transporter ZupT